MKVLILILLALLALAACGGSASSTTSPAPPADTSTVFPSVAATDLNGVKCPPSTRIDGFCPGDLPTTAPASGNHPSPANPCGDYGTWTGAGASCAPAGQQAPPSPTASPLDSDTEGVVCAGLNALKFTGDSGSDAVDTVASAQNVTTDQVMQAVDDRCPQLKDYIASG
jgi:hypothetical protein